jgi:hypothetical protein
MKSTAYFEVQADTLELAVEVVREQMTEAAEGAFLMYEYSEPTLQQANSK